MDQDVQVTEACLEPPSLLYFYHVLPRRVFSPVAAISLDQTITFLITCISELFLSKSATLELLRTHAFNSNPRLASAMPPSQPIPALRSSDAIQSSISTFLNAKTHIVGAYEIYNKTVEIEECQEITEIGDMYNTPGDSLAPFMDHRWLVEKTCFWTLTSALSTHVPAALRPRS